MYKMLLSAKEIATKYAGRTVKCKVTKSSPVNDTAGNKLDHFDARIVGWKVGSVVVGGDPSYVCVEVLSPGVTGLKLLNFKSGYTFTANYNFYSWGKKLLPEEIILPADLDKAMVRKAATLVKKKNIPEWPDKCRDCGSPALILSTRIDCSNAMCKHKFKTHSAIDLFLPADLRPPAWEKDPNRKRRAGVDKDDFVVCDNCKQRAIDGIFNKDKLGELKATCPNGHSWTSDLHIGDKIAAKDKTLIYKGKNIFIPYKV